LRSGVQFFMILRIGILFFAIFGGASALAYVAVYIHKFISVQGFIVNMIFSILIIPTYLAVITNIYDSIKVTIAFLNKGVLFVLSVCAMLIAINIIHERFGGLWYAFFTPGSDATMIAIVVIILALTVYFGLFYLIRFFLTHS